MYLPVFLITEAPTCIHSAKAATPQTVGWYLHDPFQSRRTIAVRSECKEQHATRFQVGSKRMCYFQNMVQDGQNRHQIGPHDSFGLQYVYVMNYVMTLMKLLSCCALSRDIPNCCAPSWDIIVIAVSWEVSSRQDSVKKRWEKLRHGMGEIR
jgi:hypothetical protein